MNGEIEALSGWFFKTKLAALFTEKYFVYNMLA
jgi:hypothetical protein